MNVDSGHSRPVSRFKGIYFCIAVYRKNAFLGAWDFFAVVPQVATEGGNKNQRCLLASLASSSYHTSMDVAEGGGGERKLRHRPMGTLSLSRASLLSRFAKPVSRKLCRTLQRAF